MDVFYYDICDYCKKKIHNEDKKYVSLCSQCIHSISYLAPKKHKKTVYLLYALGKYDGVLKYIVTEKYRKNTIGYYLLEKNIINIIDVFHLDFDYILPIPKTALNKLKHQLNQTKIIANIISHYYKKTIFEHVYIKNGKEDQARKKYQERSLMNKDLFFIPDSKKLILNNKKILIIDDVYTTGATIDAILDALKKINFLSISILVLARK